MPGISTSVPYGADQTLYLVVEAFGSKTSGHTAVERTSLETVIADLLSGRFNNPTGILAFNTLEHWTNDLSRDVALEIQCRCDIEGKRIPDYLEDFVGNCLGLIPGQKTGDIPGMARQ